MKKKLRISTGLLRELGLILNFVWKNKEKTDSYEEEPGRYLTNISRHFKVIEIRERQY